MTKISRYITFTSHWIRYLLTAYFLLAATASHAKAQGIVFPGSKSANIGILIHDIDADEDIASMNPDKSLTPASIIKCVTAAAVILAGKENDRFETEAFATGDILADTLLMGDIVIKASGDPTIESRHFPELSGFTDSIVAAISRLGIKRIAGYIDVDTIGFVEQGPGRKWETEDLKWSYGTGLYPMNFSDNTIASDRSMADPAHYFEQQLKHKLHTAGITVNGSDINYGEVKYIPLYIQRSPTNAEIMRNMVEISNNLFAESMLRAIEPEGYITDALETEKQILSSVGIGCDAFQPYDGSGLTRANRVTPRFMSELLLTMSRHEKSANYISLFPKAGEEGTVKKLLADTPLAGNMILKSGSMRGVLCYAGYKLDSDGHPTHTVVIIINNYTCKTLTVRKAIETYLLRIFR